MESDDSGSEYAAEDEAEGSEDGDDGDEAINVEDTDDPHANNAESDNAVEEGPKREHETSHPTHTPPPKKAKSTKGSGKSPSSSEEMVRKRVSTGAKIVGMCFFVCVM